MARYTKKDADGHYYIESVNGKLESNIFGHTYGEAIDRFAELETADVAPKSEVDYLKEHLEMWCEKHKKAREEVEKLKAELAQCQIDLHYSISREDALKDTVEHLSVFQAEAKAEVAREIFENLKEAAQHIADTYGRNADKETDFILQSNLRGAQISALVVLNTIVAYETKLKKKYIGEQNNGTEKHKQSRT